MIQKTTGGIFCCILLSFGVQGQTESGGSIVVPPSPNAASLINQSSEKVQHYTGALNVSIPIVELKSRDLTHSVNFSYNGSGNRVNDLASWVGQGWTLNAGGVITRTMRGLPDEFNGQMITSSSQGQFLPAKGYLDPAVGGSGPQNLYDYYLSASQIDRGKLINLSNKTGDYVTFGGYPEVWDTEPDEFSFNFDTYSGKFVFDKSGEVKIIPHQNLKITKVITDKTTLSTDSRRITSFEVTDARGVKYKFGNETVANYASLTAVETTSYSIFIQQLLFGYTGGYDAGYGNYVWSNFPQFMFESYQGGPPAQATIIGWYQDYLTFTSTWHLLKIQSPTGDAIDFTYADENDVSYIISQQQDIDQYNLDAFAYGNSYLYRSYPNGSAVDNGSTSGIVSGATANLHQPQNNSFSTSYNTIDVKRLTNISTSVGSSVYFNAQNNRYDLAGAKTLDDITVRDNGGFVVKKYRLDYMYSNSPEDESHIYAIEDENENYVYMTEVAGGSQAWIDLWTTMTSGDYLRLYLLSIKEVLPFDELNNIKLYEFEYDFPIVGQETLVLPRRMSFRQDKFGFFNNNSVGHRIPRKEYTANTLAPQVFYFSWAQPGVKALINGYDEATEHPDLYFACADLSVNFDRMKTGTLKSVKYPTGGKRQFVYGLNKINNTVNAAGLRIEEIRVFPDANLPYYESILYSYKDGRYASDINDQFNMYHLPFEGLVGYENNWNRDRVFLSSSSVFDVTNTRGGIVGYKSVEEYKPLQGKTSYYFKSPYDIQNELDATMDVAATAHVMPYGFPFQPKNDFDHLRGNLDSIVVSNEAGKRLSKTTYTYSVNPEGFVPSLVYGMKPGKFSFEGQAYYLAGFYKYKNDWVVETQTVEEFYDQLDPGRNSKKSVTTTTTSFKKPGGSVAEADLLPRKTTKTLPNNDKVITENKYVNDYLPVAYATSSDLNAKGLYRLKQSKVESAVIESITYLEKPSATKYMQSGRLLFFREYAIPNSGLAAFPYLVKEYKPGAAAFTSFTWSSIPFSTVVNGVNSGTDFTFAGATTAGQYKDVRTFNSYDLYGNPLSVTESDGIENTYTWSDNNDLLATHTQNPGTFQHQTSYLHNPMVGPATITDPNGRVTRFTYDDFNRLSLVKDHDNNITNRYRYFYRTDNVEMIPGTLTAAGCLLPNQAVSFTATGKVPNGQTQYEWNFGDGQTAITTSSYTSHTYATGGSKAVSVKRTNSEYYGSSTSTLDIQIAVPVTYAEICVEGVYSYDVCHVNPNSTSTCGGTPPGGVERVGKPKVVKNRGGSQSVGPGGVTLPTIQVRGIVGTATGFAWQYRTGSGSWSDWGGNSTVVTGPPGFGDGIPGGWEVRCVVYGACGTTYITSSFYFSAYASTTNCN